MQYVYRRYGRHRAALTSAVITYRSRSAVRDVGRALGLSQDQIERLAGNRIWWQNNQVIPERVREIGLDPKGRFSGDTTGKSKHLSAAPEHARRRSSAEKVGCPQRPKKASAAAPAAVVADEEAPAAEVELVADEEIALTVE